MKYPLRFAVHQYGGEWIAYAWSRACETAYRVVPVMYVVRKPFETQAEAWVWIRGPAAKEVAKKTAEYGRPLDALEEAAIDPETPEDDRREILDALVGRDYPLC